MSLTKAKIIEKISTETNINKKDIRGVVGIFFQKITETLEKGEEVKLSGFGNFYLRDKKERLGRNPKTKEECLIPPRRIVKCKLGQKLQKEMLDNTKKIDKIKT